MARTETRRIVDEPLPGVAIVEYEGYGRRLVPIAKTRSATVWRKRCLHRRPIGIDREDVRVGDQLTWVQICRLCFYELDVLEREVSS